MIFSKKQTALMGVCKGTAVALSEMPDEAFSSGMLGIGYAIEPEDGQFYAPMNGRVESVAEARHAYTLQSDEGLEILIHIGVDTVSLGGEGFVAEVKAGDRVCVGEPLVHADLELIRSKGLPTMTAVLLTNPERTEHTEYKLGKVAGAHDAVMRFRLRRKG